MADAKLDIELRAKDEASRAIRNVGKAGEETAEKLNRGLIKSLIATGIKLAAIIGAARLAASGIRAITSDFGSAGDELNKLSEKLGVSVEDLSALKGEAELASIPFATMTTGVRFLAKNLVDFKRGAGEAKLAFEDLGLSASDFAGLGIQDVIGLLADRFAELKDGPEKTAAAMRIFGRAGADLIPFLNQGSEAIREQRKDIERLGGVLTKDQAQAATLYEDSMTRLTIASRGLRDEIGSKVVPVITGFTEGLLYLLRPAQEVEEEVERIAERVRGFTTDLRSFLDAAATARSQGDLVAEVEAVDTLVQEYERALERMEALNTNLVSFHEIAAQVPADQVEALRQQLAEMDALTEVRGPDGLTQITVSRAAAFEALRTVLGRLVKRQRELHDVEIPEQEAAEQAKVLAEERATAQEKFNASLAETKQSLRDEIALMKVGEGSRKAARVVLQAQRAAQKQGVELSKEEAAELLRLAQALDLVSRERKKAEVTPPDPTFLQALRGELTEIKKGLDDVAQRGREVAQDLVYALGSALDNGFFKVIEGGFESTRRLFKELLADILKGFAQIAARQATAGLISGAIGLVPGLAQGGIVPGNLKATVPVHAYQGGGVATSPQLALFGEGGGPGEAFIPLGPNRKVGVELRGEGGGSASNVNLTLNVQALDAQSFSTYLNRPQNVAMLKNLVVNAVNSDDGFHRAINRRR